MKRISPVVPPIRCPVCNSRDVCTDFTAMEGSHYLCKRCGYRGSFVISSDENDSL
jgi:transposase-like protein